MASFKDLPSKLDRGNELLYVQMVFVILAGICVIIRAYVKTFIVKHHSVDDYLIYFALAMYITSSSIAMDGVVNGATGKHYALMYTMDQASRSLRDWYICMLLYAPMTMTIRASVCVLLLRISSTRRHRWIIWLNFCFIAAISIAFFIVLIFQCTPVSYFWTQTYATKGSCPNMRVTVYTTLAHSIVSSLSDWCLGLLPVWLLWNIKINRRTKAIVAFLLSLGMMAGIVLVVRIPFITRLPPGLQFLYNSVDVAIWSVLEPALGIIAACVATFRPLFQNWGFGWTSDSKKSSDNLQLSSPRSWKANSRDRHVRHANHPGRTEEDEDSIVSNRNGCVTPAGCIEVKTEVVCTCERKQDPEACIGEGRSPTDRYF